MPLSGIQTIVCPTLIGRVRELALLTELIIQSSKESSENGPNSNMHAAFIVGEAGIGKSRLVKEAATIAIQHGMLLLQGRCFEQDQTFPYAPLIDMLNAFCVRHSSSELELALRQSAPELVKVFPELSVYLHEAVPSPVLDLEQEKRRLYHAWKQFISHIGETAPRLNGDPVALTSPVFMVIEDLHWCDDNSLDFLLYLARTSIARHLVLIGTYRSDEVHEALAKFLTELDRLRLLTEFQLQRLSIGETDLMLRAILGSNRPVGYDILETLFGFTEGNPFFIEEALKTILESNKFLPEADNLSWKPAYDLHVPRTLQVAVQSRLGKLSFATRNLLFHAAVMGRRFNVSILQKILGKSDTDLSEHLRELIRAQLVIEESTDTFAFRHALTREAIYQNLLGRERKELHNTIGYTLERIHSDRIEPYLNDLAYHFYEAEEWPKAFDYAQRAGERAQVFDATRVALVQFTRALEAANRLYLAPPLPLLRSRGQAHQTLGNLAAARKDYEQILEVARSTHDRQAEWQSLLDLGFSWTSQDYQQAGDYFQQALVLAREFRKPILLAQTLDRVGNWRFMAGQPFEGRKLHEEALGIVQLMDDPRALAATLDLLGISSYGVGDLRKGGDYYKKAVSIYRRLGDRQGLIPSLCAYIARGGGYITMTGVCAPTETTEVIRSGEEAVQIANQMGWRPNEAYALSFFAFSLGPHGEFERTLQAGLRSLSIATEVGHHFSIITAHVALGALYLDLLDPQKAHQHFEMAADMAQNAGAVFVSTNVTAYLVKTYLALNEIERAQDLLKSAFSIDIPLDSEANRWLWTARAEYLLAMNKTSEALEITEHIISAVPHVEEGGVSTRLWLVKGQALHALNLLPSAEAILAKDLSVAQECQLLPQIWQIQIALGKVLSAQRRLTEAQELFISARMTIEKLAQNSPDGIVREQFRSSALSLIPLSSSSDRQVMKKEFGGLTSRERGVAFLISQGKSNIEIAEELVLSRRTVEVHIANIMSKLGFHARAQIAVWASEKELNK